MSRIGRRFRLASWIASFLTTHPMWVIFSRAETFSTRLATNGWIAVS